MNLFTNPATGMYSTCVDIILCILESNWFSTYIEGHTNLQFVSEVHTINTCLHEFSEEITSLIGREYLSVLMIVIFDLFRIDMCCKELPFWSASREGHVVQA